MTKTFILKFTACFMAMLLTISCFSAGLASACPDVEIYAYEDFNYEILTDYDDDYNPIQYISITGYVGNSAKVEIPPVINSIPVTNISYRAFAEKESITSVCVPDSVTSIDADAFYNCQKLTEINLPSTLTFIGQDILKDTPYADKNIKDGLLYCENYLLSSDINALPENVTVKEGTTLISAGTFYGSKINSVNLPESLRIINDNAFSNCSNLNSLTVPQGVENIDYGVFSKCSSLDEVSLPSTLKIIGRSCFSDCVSLTSLDIPESVEEIPDGLITGCKNITSFEIKDTVYFIGSAFTNSGVESIHIPASVVYINSLAFGGCSSLDEITVDENNEVFYAENNALFKKSSINGSISLIRISCDDSSESFVIPDDVSEVSFDAFSGNFSLKNLTLGKNTTVVYDASAPNLENIFVHPENEMFSSVDGVLLSKDSTELIYYPTGKTDKKYTVPSEVTTIRSGCFIDNPYLTELTIPDTVKTLNHTVVESCENLTTINMGPCEATYFWPILFCDSLTTINFSGTVSQWEAMDIDVYNEENKAGLYVYCTDGMITLEESEYDDNLGDVNKDSKLNIRDATAIQKHLAKIATLSDEILELADYNEDGKVNVRDATTIQKKIAGLI